MSEFTIELQVKVLNDPAPSVGIDGVYLFAQTVDNEQSVLKAAADLIAQGKARQILIPDSEPRCGYPGFNQWVSTLIDYDVPKERIVGVPTASFDSLNTYTEALAAVNYTTLKRFETLSVMATPFHQLRAFISIVSASLKNNSSLKLYNVVGYPLPWHETVSHSQGSLVGTRESFIYSELERIRKYQQKGDLVAEAMVLDYLRKRDKLMPSI